MHPSSYATITLETSAWITVRHVFLLVSGSVKQKVFFFFFSILRMPTVLGQSIEKHCQVFRLIKTSASLPSLLTPHRDPWVASVSMLRLKWMFASPNDYLSQCWVNALALFARLHTLTQRRDLTVASVYQLFLGICGLLISRKRSDIIPLSLICLPGAVRMSILFAPLKNSSQVDRKIRTVGNYDYECFAFLSVISFDRPVTCMWVFSCSWG